MATLHADDASSSPHAGQARLPIIHAPAADRDQVSEALSKLHHDLKNPLSIISGNAQFLIEVGKEAGWGHQAVASLEDIEEAAERLASSLDQIKELREEL